MILVDSSVVIDRIKGRSTPQVDQFERLILARQTLGIGDLVLVEVLQGVRDERAHRAVAADLSAFEQVQISDTRVALAAARHYRLLRDRGYTVRKTIDTLIATRCILDRIPLLYSDRDFQPFVEHLGLISALPATGAIQ